MHRWAAALLLALLTGVAFAQAPVADADKARTLIEQKIRLVEMLINSPAARNAPYGREAEAAALVEHGQQAIDEARQALAAERFDEAGARLDEAIKFVSAASRRLSGSGTTLPESAQRKNLQDLADQVAMYRASVYDMTRSGNNQGAARDLLARIDALSAESQQLSNSGRFADASRAMAEAYKIAVEEISRLRAGEQVVMSLQFDTPAEEFAYEQRRYGSNEIMVEMMIGEGRAEGDRRRLVDRFVDEGRRLKGEADARARAGQYEDAIALMEQATGQLNRALQSMGVPVF